MSDREVVTPRWSRAGYETDAFGLGYQNSGGCEYPIEVQNHRVRVRYAFEKQNGSYKRVRIEYFCPNCGTETFIEHPRLHEENSANVQRARKWMLGYILSQDCI